MGLPSSIRRRESYSHLLRTVIEKELREGWNRVSKVTYLIGLACIQEMLDE